MLARCGFEQPLGLELRLGIHSPCARCVGFAKRPPLALPGSTINIAKNIIRADLHHLGVDSAAGVGKIGHTVGVYRPADVLLVLGPVDRRVGSRVDHRAGGKLFDPPPHPASVGYVEFRKIEAHRVLAELPAEFPAQQPLRAGYKNRCG